ncbi:MAG: hypothetical protein KUG63_09160 [Cycloclasticus sp.]|uniref:hypothetical protein n=1 Tax=Cycloclasticus sp. TaxID=2024830 RepID=UPI00257B5B3A|nr:hypothetical protein [Cycloclasticus sp.]MBV1899521.1 hypothetical protein [Cycloclasticus sp.]
MTLIIWPYAFGGDQVHYRMVYEKLGSLDLIEGYSFYNQALSAYELGHFILSWLFARVLEQNIFIACANLFLGYFAMQLFKKWGVSLFIAAPIVLTNFYFLVLYFSAERLKFGVLFFLISMLCFDRLRCFYSAIFFAIISHFQMLIIYSGQLFCYLAQKLAYFFQTLLLSKRLLLLMVFFFLLGFLTLDALLIKFDAYLEFRGVSNLFRITIFLALALFYSKKRTETVLVFIPLIVAVILVGGERVNMFGYFAFLYYALPVNRGVNVGVLVTSTYYTYWSVFFLKNIIEYGDGFYVG